MARQETSATPEIICTLITDDSEHFLAWPAGRTVPDGWRETGTYGSREELAIYVRDVMGDTAPAPLILSERPRTWWGDLD